MQSERTEALRAGHDAWNRGDWETLRALYAPDVVADPGALWPSNTPLQGPEALFKQFELLQTTFEDCQVLADDYIERGDAVVVSSRWCGRLGGNPVEQRVFVTYTFRGPQVSRIAYFDTVDEALEAADGASQSTRPSSSTKSISTS
jgi:ketosteroid isomerase-like protein